MRRIVPVLAVLVLSWTCPAARAADVLDDTAHAIAGQISAKPDLGTLYGPAFLKAVPPDRLSTLYRDLHRQHGVVTAVMLASRSGPFAGRFTFRFARDVEVPVTLTLAPAPPHQVVGLWFGPPAPAVKSVDEVLARLDKLPGRTAFAWVRLGDAITPVKTLRPDEVLPIGSAFKLYVLGAVLERKLAWDSVVRLDAASRSLPTGELRNWPAGAPVTVHTLATLMISQSDNTATDQLLRTVGRGAVEAVQGPMGHADPARNAPFLTTREAFQLKADEPLLGRYAAADASGRRAILESLAARPVPPLFDLSRPTGVLSAEWFASPLDLCRALDWLRRRGDAEALAILAVNPGVPEAAERFAYAGYKGGSEPGVMCMAWLLRARDGTWHAVAGAWCDQQATVDDLAFIGLMKSAVVLISSGGTTSAPASGPAGR